MTLKETLKQLKAHGARRRGMHTLSVFLVTMVGCAALYAVAGLICFNPRSATYSTETSHPETEWFSSIEELMASRAQAEAATSESAKSRDQDIELPARLVGPSPRGWFRSLTDRCPIASV